MLILLCVHLFFVRPILLPVVKAWKCRDGWWESR